MMDQFSLKNKVAFITGASSGFGRHFALTLAKAGADIIVAARRMDKLAEVAKEVEALGRKALCVSLDISQAQSVNAAVKEAAAKMGHIDILINNAGNVVRKPALEFSEAEWDSLSDVHLKGTWLMSQAVAKQMIAQAKPGVIINISSVMASRTRQNALAYSVAKAGVSHLTRSLALELIPHNIRVNAIAPGWFITDLNRDVFTTELGAKIIGSIPMGRTGKIEELEGPLLLLASDASSYMSGVIIPVDGAYATEALYL